MTSPRTPAPDRRDDSVMFALGELARLESERVADEQTRERQRAEEARRATERAAAEREAEALRQAERAASERAVAEARARLEVEAQIAQDARMTTLRAELARVSAEREAMHRSVIEAARPDATPATSRGWPLAFGLSSVVAAALAGLLVMQAQVTPRVIEVERRVVVSAPAATTTLPASIEAETETVREVVAADPRVAPAAAAPTRRPPVHHRPPTRPDPTHEDELDLGDDDDVIGGLGEDTDMFGPRRRTR